MPQDHAKKGWLNILTDVSDETDDGGELQNKKKL